MNVNSSVGIRVLSFSTGAGSPTTSRLPIVPKHARGQIPCSQIRLRYIIASCILQLLSIFWHSARITVDSSVASSVQDLTRLGYRIDGLDPGPLIDQRFRYYCNGPTSGCKDHLNPVPQNSSLMISNWCGGGQLQDISCFFDIWRQINPPTNPDIEGQGVRFFNIIVLAPIYCTRGSRVLKVFEHRQSRMLLECWILPPDQPRVIILRVSPRLRVL